jgi:hypothetical protein
MLGHEEKARERRIITSYRAQREGKVRTPSECEEVRNTHLLTNAERGTSQDAKQKRDNEGHPRTIDCRGRDKSGRQQKWEGEGTHRLSIAEGGSSQVTK